MFRLISLVIVATLLGAIPTPLGHATAPHRPSERVIRERRPPANSLTWKGPSGGLWSTPGNWAGGDGKQIPKTGDTISFDGMNNTSSKNDISNLSIAKLILPAKYTASLALANDLTVTGDITLSEAKIVGPKTLKVPNATSTFNWYGGELAAKVELGSAGKIATLNITAGKAGVKLANVFTSFASTTWTGTGDITMDTTGGTSRFINGVGSTFEIKTGQKIIAVGRVIPVILNRGTFHKSGGGKNTTIEAMFLSSGTIIAGVSTLSFAKGVTQTAGEIMLNGGWIATDGVFSLLGGTLCGIGMIYGDVTNSAGTVSPGLGGGPGQLNVVGNYVQGADGQLLITISARGDFGCLSVQKDGLNGGDADMLGKLTVNRNAGFEPPNKKKLEFIKFATNTTANDFSTFEYPNNSWNNGGARSFSAKATATTYDLWVK